MQHDVATNCCAILFPESSFPLTNGRKTRALGASETGWAEFGYFHCYSKWLLPELSFSDRWSAGTKALGTRLIVALKVALCAMIHDVDF